MAQSPTRLRIQKATTLLREDHHRVKNLLKEYESMGEVGFHHKAELFGKIQDDLVVHAMIEEEIFYPSVESVQKGRKDGEGVVKEAVEEHKIIKTLLVELSDITPAHPSFDAKMKVLTDTVVHHAGEEEHEMFPLFDQLPKEEQSRITERLNIRKRELTEPTES